MPIEVTCDGCGARFKAPDAAAGKKGKCKKCGAVITIPVPEPVGAPAEEDDMYDIAEPAPAPAKPYKPAGTSDAVAPAPPYRPPPPIPSATSSAMMSRGVVAKSAGAGSWKNSNNPPKSFQVLKGIGGIILILFGLLLVAAPILTMMSDKTGKTIRFKGLFFGLFLIVSGGGMVLRAFGIGGGGE